MPAAGTGRLSTARLPPSTRWVGRRRRRFLSPGTAVRREPPAISSQTRSTPPTGGPLRSRICVKLGNPDRRWWLSPATATLQPSAAIISFMPAGDIDLTVVCMNNQIYGMTVGRGSPTTPLGAVSRPHTPYGCAEIPFDLCELATAAGATVLAGPPDHVEELVAVGRTRPSSFRLLLQRRRLRVRRGIGVCRRCRILRSDLPPARTSPRAEKG